MTDQNKVGCLGMVCILVLATLIIGPRYLLEKDIIAKEKAEEARLIIVRSDLQKDYPTIAVTNMFIVIPLKEGANPGEITEIAERTIAAYPASKLLKFDDGEIWFLRAGY